MIKFTRPTKQQTVMTDQSYLKNLRCPTVNNPLKILSSSCLIGQLCGANGSSYGTYPLIKKIEKFSNVSLIPFCPEHFSFGTPREIPDIENGTGLDVLQGKARVITQSGNDVTQEMIKASEVMLKLALEKKIELAILMDVSGACGSQVIYKGHRLKENHAYQIGMGVCAAQLHKHGIKIISQRDFASLEILLSKLDSTHTINSKAVDHHQTDWFKDYFNKI